MNKGRKSIGVFLGRLFQSIPPFLYSWVEVLYKKKEISKYPMIFLVSIPRSGSTLTYQILSRGTKSYVLTNLWNILYAIPLIGALVSKRKRNDNTDFNSDRGLVNGILGESEGLKFWKYWIGQGLEDISEFNMKGTSYLKKVFGRLLSKEQPFISSFLGHSFSINYLRKSFPGSIFIYMKRDPLSNIYSIYQTGKEFAWFSLKPKNWDKVLDYSDTERFIWQYKNIKQKIDSEISEEDTIIVNYEDICNNPHKFLKQIKEFAKEHEINIQLCLDNIPDSFHISKINPDKDDIAKQISQLLNEK
jgi:hypothetical protein